MLELKQMGQVSGCCFFSGIFLSSVGFFVLMILWIWRNKKKKGRLYGLNLAFCPERHLYVEDLCAKKNHL